AAAVCQLVADFRRLRQFVGLPRRRELVLHERAGAAAQRGVHPRQEEPGGLHGVSDARRRERPGIPHQSRDELLTGPRGDAIMPFIARRTATLLAGTAALLCLAAQPARVSGQADNPNEFYDSHFHLTNYVQQGITPRQFLQIMGTRVGRSTLFGIPLQQQWSYANSGNFAPTYYLQSDAPLYYYSFTDAYIASVYKALTPAEQARFDPMITGFNPADMYGVD